MAVTAIRQWLLEDLAFDEDAHVYTHGPTRHRLPNVTGIMAASRLGFNPEGVPAVVLERVSERGRFVHRSTELYDAGDLDEERMTELYPRYFGYVESYKAELALSGFQTTHTERRMYHPLRWYAGTADRVGFRKGRRIGRELKTGSHEDVAVQCAAYDALWEYWHPNEPIEEWECVKLWEDGRPASVIPVDAKAALGVFNAALLLDRYRNGVRR